MTFPGYWVDETSGVLRPVIEKYLRGEDLTTVEVATMRAYLRQWVDGLAAAGAINLDELRRRAPLLSSRSEIDEWIADATDAGVDPL